MGPSVQPLHRSTLETPRTDPPPPPHARAAAAARGPGRSGPVSLVKEPTLTDHRRAPQNLRHRWTTDALHFGALVAADLVALAVVMALYLGFRDRLWLGSAVSDIARALVPTGYLRGGEYVSALLLGLLITGNYSYGD